MAVENRYFPNRPLFSSFQADGQAFHRSHQESGLRARSSKKVITLKHIILAFSLVTIFFVGLAGIYYYAISCQALEIKEVEVISASPLVKQEIENYLSQQKPGNILVCDLNYLRLILNRLPGVKDVRLEKILPSVLKVEAFPRMPRLYVHQKNYQLIDEEGVIIASYSEPPDETWPIFEDGGNWWQYYPEKVLAVCRALGQLEPALRARIRTIKLIDYESLEIQLAGQPVKIMADEANLAENLTYYLSSINSWAEQFGPVEYVDLRLADRIYLKPLNLQAEKASDREKEVS
ncbi:MAG: cell division protein FtsQ/DivIB [Acidobacteriota bacterium]|nr:cell division protein FtsQ/DivIB [Acidobacteriota bacterium]